VDVHGVISVPASDDVASRTTLERVASVPKASDVVSGGVDGQVVPRTCLDPIVASPSVHKLAPDVTAEDVISVAPEQLSGTGPPFDHVRP
jgi:hypothetical protein